MWEYLIQTNTLYHNGPNEQTKKTIRSHIQSGHDVAGLRKGPLTVLLRVTSQVLHLSSCRCLRRGRLSGPVDGSALAKPKTVLPGSMPQPKRCPAKRPTACCLSLIPTSYAQSTWASSRTQYEQPAAMSSAPAVSKIGRPLAPAPALSAEPPWATLLWYRIDLQTSWCPT